MSDFPLIGSVRLDPGSGPVVEFEQTYDTDVTDLWHAVTDAGRLARWFAPVDGDLTEGGRFTIRFDDGEVPGCRVTACDAPRSFVWEWPHGEQSSRIAVQVLPAGNRARLRLTHTGCTEDSAPAYAAGWHVYVIRLEEYLGGREVRDSWFEDWPTARDAYAALLA